MPTERQGHAFHLGVDVGGTFTDLILYDEEAGQIHAHKLPSTPADPSVAIAESVREVCEIAGTEPSQLSGAVARNHCGDQHDLGAQRSACGIATTEGVRDILHIARHRKPYNFSIMQDIPQQSRPLVLRQLRRCVTERVLTDGSVLTPLDEEMAERELLYLAAQHVDSVAICLLSSFANPTHEQRLKHLAERLCPDAFVSVSSEIAPQHREYERFSTTAINLYIGPRVGRYLNSLRESLEDSGMRRPPHLMQSSGGMTTFEEGHLSPVNLVLSGPAAGLLGGIDAARRSGFANMITLDVGGTSADICVAPEGQARMKHLLDSSIDGYPVMVPMIDIETIGAGGGSVSAAEDGRVIRVGPESAGADSGPAAYGRGGRSATVTDANVVLGRLRPEAFLGGRMRLDPELARGAVSAAVAEPLGLSLEAAAVGVVAVTVHNMVNAIETNSARKGYDPREFVLVATGGAGPLHAAQIARAIGIPHVVVPPHPGVTAAAGLLASDLRYERVATAWQDLTAIDTAALGQIYGRLEEAVREHLVAAGFADDQVELERWADCRYVGQGYELRVPAPVGAVTEAWAREVRDAFEARHEREYFGRFSELGVHLVTVHHRRRAHARAAVATARPPARGQLAGARAGAGRGVRPGRWRRAAAHEDLLAHAARRRRRDLGAGHRRADRLDDAATAARVISIDGVFPDLDDQAGFLADVVRARRLGFRAKSTFNPRQVEAINDYFSPTEEELDYARRVVAAFEAAVERGDAAVAVGGQLVDLPIVRRAEGLLALADRLARSGAHAAQPAGGGGAVSEREGRRWGS